MAMRVVSVAGVMGRMSPAFVAVPGWLAVVMVVMVAVVKGAGLPASSPARGTM
jgi:hypothetical protein